MTTREVELTGGAPWGFRMHGGADQNQPLRISRVNPGRKASLSGIREGDIISSINGQSTKTMTNVDAHAMLRSAGPILRLGLNEDREMSPRRRSIGRTSELKRPSYLLSEVNNETATPQAPVYATIRPANSSQNRTFPTPAQSSLHSLPTALNSTSMVKSIATTNESLQFHPTNPFYSTLPLNYSSASKLPIPNGRVSMSGLDKSKSLNKSEENSLLSEHDSDVRTPSSFSTNESGPHSTIFFNHVETGNTNGYESEILKLSENDKGCPFIRDNNLKIYNGHNETKSNEKNPFKIKRNSDPIDKYFRNNGDRVNNLKTTTETTIPISMSDSDIHKKESETNHLSVKKHVISEIEELKTIKKITLNASEVNDTKQNAKLNTTTINTETTKPESWSQNKAPAREHYIKVQYSPKIEDIINKSQYNSSNNIMPKEKYNRGYNTSVNEYKSLQEERNNYYTSAVRTPADDLVVTKPPLKSPSAATTASLVPKLVWRPGAPPPAPSGSPGESSSAARSPSAPPPPPPPIWTPTASPQAPRKNFRPVHFEDTPPARRKFASAEQNGCTSGSESEGRLRTSQSAPATGLSALGGTSSSRLPRAQNPTVTLLQKARENQISRAPTNIHERDPRLPRDRPSPPIGDPVHALRKGYLSEGEADRRDYFRGGSNKMADANRTVEGIGPTTKEGMPVALRSEVKDPSKWYKKMYDTIHKNKYDDDYVTIRYKNRQGHPPLRVSSSKSQYAYFDPRSGYLSEPEGGLSRLGYSTWTDAYDSDATTPRRRTASVQEERREDAFTQYLPSNKYSTLASARASQEVYKNQPGRIENYMPGKSSVIDKEAKQWWDEVMDIFDGWLDDNSPLPPYTTLLARAIQKSQNISSTTSLPQTSPKEKKDITSNILSKSNMARALKESGYESDSTLVFRRREETDAPLSPAERRAAYRDLQAGGEPPIRGFRSPAPPRQDDTEIEYIPISSTLTKIRVHKKTPLLHEVICYPISSTKPMKSNSTGINKCTKLDRPDIMSDCPPAPPRRMSSKNSKTLKFVTSSRHSSISPNRSELEKSNVHFLRNKISHKLNRQNTHVIIKKVSADIKTNSNSSLSKYRGMSTSAPPPINRKISNTISTYSIPKKTVIERNTSSFSSPRRTLQPTEYSSRNKYGESNTSVIIENGAGRKTPISNILDKVTSLDKLWSSQKRNERIDLTKHREKYSNKFPITDAVKSNPSKPSNFVENKTLSRNVTHKSRDMVRTSEKLQKNKSTSKPGSVTPLDTMKHISKSISNIPASTRKQLNVRTAAVTNLKKKKSLESVIIKPKSVPCHEICNKKSKGTISKKEIRPKYNKKGNTTSLVDLESRNEFVNKLPKTLDFSILKDAKQNIIHSKDLKKTHDSIVSDSFFRHLFLRNASIPVISAIESNSMNSVLQKAKLFQSLPHVTHSTSNSLNAYLIHRKPVSLSRFKVWDKNCSPSRISGTRSVSWPGRMDGEIRKFQSLSKCDSFGSTSSISSARSKSEPPANKIYFSQTSRPVSPNIFFYKKEKPEVKIKRNSVSPSKIVYLPKPISFININKTPQHQTKALSPSRAIIEKSKSTSTKYMQSPLKIKEPQGDKSLHTIFFTQTSRPVSPNVIKSSICKSRSQSSSPVPFRSPSYRRIHNARIHSKQVNEGMSKKEIRTRSADYSKDIHKLKENVSFRAKSDSKLNVHDPDYDEYIRDLQNSKVRTERFRELNRYYTYLERVAELEKATSAYDLRNRKKDKEIIDFDRWKKIRTIERAEEELNNLYHKLKLAQNENSILFYPKDLNDFRWDSSRERGLRVKEKSVEDLKDEFQQKVAPDPIESNQLKDYYKPLWRGTSVAETAFNINRKNETNTNKSRITIKPTIAHQQESSLSELQKKIGLGNHLWSSLSIEQVSALKRQLNAIYSKELEAKSNKESEKYTVEIKDAKCLKKPKLHVRCNSLVITPTASDLDHELSKSDSIAAISYPVTTAKDIKNNVNKMQMTLSEIEKKKISQSLSKEVLHRINKHDNTLANPSMQDPISNLERDQSATENKNIAENKTDQDTNTHYLRAKEVTDERKRLIVYPADKNESTCQASISETETGSSDISNKTVIYKAPCKEVLKKVEYFETVNHVVNQPKVIYHARDNSCDNKSITNSSTFKNKESHQIQISQSQSCTNLKELFGESDRNKYLSLPSKPDLLSRSPSPYSEVCISDRRTPDTLRYSSDEAIWCSRTPSPDPERYWRAYIKLARAGEVRRLARRFDSPSAAGAVLRRHQSDPEITRNVLHNNWSSVERISSHRDKYRVMLPVARVPLRPTNRYMPHIDIISKLAALKRRTSPRSRSAEEVLECRPGEVERIRRRFEAMSLLGPIYSSAPDVREISDIAPYLTGSWIAHRYPKPSDNNRSCQDPALLGKGQKVPTKKEVNRAVSKDTVMLNSILKNELLAKQEFDPSVHRPTSRYEPPRAPPRPPPAAWSYRLAPFITPSRHTVTFQETDSAPEPPRRMPHGSYSDTESPSRRYVESDVNIHYRCPVRHDPLPLVPERELARQQAEHMKRLYKDQRRNKYLQEKDIHPFDIEAFDASIKELQDMQNRRHQDNFMPSQKTVVPLNRYDEAEKLVARAMYAFNGQTTRELSFKKGDLISIRRQIDANWYEGEVHGRIGLFPYNYVEILKGEYAHSPKKPIIVEGQARAKFDFTAQTNLELPLKKGEVVVLTRRIDHNWWEGRNSARTGIFPESYITILQEPSQTIPPPQTISNIDKPAASPAAHGLVNGAARRTLQQHSYTPQHNSPALANAPPSTAPLPGYVAKPAQTTLTPSERGYGPPGAASDLNNAEPLYVDTNAEAVPYRAMYKYRPQNPDELELQEGDTVYVLEKCDDGWYVGSSQRTGRFGTFPGNYVERI